MEGNTVHRDEETQKQDEPDEGMKIALCATIMKEVQQLGRKKFHCSHSAFYDRPNRAIIQ